MRYLAWALGIIGIVVLLFVGLFVSGTAYVVPEYEQVVVTRFGEVQYAVITGLGYTEEGEVGDQIEYMQEQYPDQVYVDAGLYFKIPFLDQAHRFDARILDWDGDQHEISTADLRTLIVESSARWRIRDPILFFESVGNEAAADQRIGAIINSRLEDAISETQLIEVVRNQRLELEEDVQRQLEEVEEQEEEIQDFDEIRYGRQDMVDGVLQRAREETRSRYGVELVDVLLTRINYTDRVREQVYDRMIAERERIAARFRSEGEELKREITGEIEERRQTLLSEAERQIRRMRGEAEGQAIDIWADAYTQNPEFFRFQRSLEVYESGMEEDAFLILSDDNDLLEHFTNIESSPD